MALGFLVWLLALAVIAAFASPRWRMPAAISEHGRQFDEHLVLTFLIVGAIFLAAQLALGWAIIRYRRRAGRAAPTEGNQKLEALWTTGAVVLFLGIALVGARIFAGVRIEPPPANAMRVETLGRQFSWSFRYAGRDGKFGRLDIKQINDSGGNPFGVDEKDPAGRDDIVTSALRVPVDTPVVLILRSRDVIHSFFVRELRLKQDLVPGMEIPLHFKAETPGTYEAACSELCGLGHHQMRTVVEVLSADGYRKWLEGMEQQLAQTQAGQ
jgi:cytochrome c oxidase subunit 2